MAVLPEQRTQPTVDAIYRAYEARAETGHRPHLGASIIGRECARALWYTFRWCGTGHHEGRLLRLFQRGQLEEAVFIDDLKRLGLTVYDTDPRTGGQFRHADIGGHFGGSMDGCALGLLEAPKTWHVLEFKTFNAKTFAVLKKQGVSKAKPEHVAQMQLYMHWSGMTRAFYLAVCKDNDELYSERIRYDKAQAERLIAKARRVIGAPEPLERISERPDWYQCQWCDHRGTCHERAWPAVNCRTCAHATPETDTDHGRWSCARFGCDIDTQTQRQGDQCPAHVYIPALVPWQQVDASDTEGWVEYQTDDGRTVRNGPSGYASRELATGSAIIGDPVADELRSRFGAEVVA